MLRVLVLGSILFIVLFLAPAALRAVLYWRAPAFDWRGADRSATGLLPAARLHSDAAVRVFAARTVSWRGIVAVHSWIVLKDRDAARYDRYDLTAWGDPIRLNGFDPDGRWFGQAPDTVFAADGDAAEALIPRMRAAIQAYRWRNVGDYRAWPGPNSNTFVQTVLAAVPESGAVLPPTAIGKDFPVDGAILGPAPSRTGFRLSFGGYVGLTLAWVEGFELNVLGGVIGLDFRRPGLKLPAVGRVGV
ncbi:DUF3750 domain-containing protein [Lichenibacterium ramalinae]|uniref:DUF3750 domain-containing protein n=1 Tax=Lichenibacterium ramalinae TaxID=2316527 RepID=A0A4Q2RGE6_9HYPH|nr:DUF3750 domain-containing protein [Lichenibacterium ramalinae]RYB05634.1 DUF3750 domain-containing protein [Lichenibacterium ramalinae]